MTDLFGRHLTLGQVNEIIAKLGGEEGALRFLRGEVLPEDPPIPAVGAWMTIMLGKHKTGDKYREALLYEGLKIGTAATQMLIGSRFDCESNITELGLVNRTVGELGFDTGVSFDDALFQRIEKMNLEACPAEAGPALRLSYTKQPYAEVLIIGMRPIRLQDKELYVFVVENDRSGPCLRVIPVGPYRKLHANTHIVCAVPKAAASGAVAQCVRAA